MSFCVVTVIVTVTGSFKRTGSATCNLMQIPSSQFAPGRAAVSTQAGRLKARRVNMNKPFIYGYGARVGVGTGDGVRVGVG